MRYRYFFSQNSDKNSSSITTTATPQKHHPSITAAGRAAKAAATHCCHRQLCVQVIPTADETNEPKMPTAASRYLFFGIKKNTTHLLSVPSVSRSTIHSNIKENDAPQPPSKRHADVGWSCAACRIPFAKRSGVPKRSLAGLRKTLSPPWLVPGNLQLHVDNL